MLLEESKGLLNTARELNDHIQKGLGYVRDNSLIDASRDARVDALAVVSDDLLVSPELDDMLLTSVNLISVFYMLATQLSNEVSGISVGKRLGKYSTRRRVFENNMVSIPEDVLPIHGQHHELTGEGKGDNGDPNLGVGRMVSIKIGTNKESATIDVLVRLDVIPVTARYMTNLLTGSVTDDGIVERTHKLKSGGITYKEWLLASDIVDRRFKGMIEDVDNIQQGALSRARKGKLAGLFNEEPSLNIASSVFIISEDIRMRVEKLHRGKISNEGVRNKIFNELKAFIICVMDRNRERVVIYYRNLPYGTSISFKALRKSKKGSDTDLAEVLKTLTTGNVPVF